MASPRRPAFAQTSQQLEVDVSKILQATSSQAPASDLESPLVVLTIGLPATGKSTFTRRLAPLIDATILESDAIRRLLFEQPGYTRAESKRLFIALHEAARNLLGAGHNIIIDATSIRESDRRPVYGIAAAAGAPLLLLNFRATPEVIEQRLTRRADALDPGDSSSAGLGIYRRMAARAEQPLREHWTIDTTNAAETDGALNRLVEACRSEAGLLVGGTR